MVDPTAARGSRLPALAPHPDGPGPQVASMTWAVAPTYVRIAVRQLGLCPKNWQGGVVPTDVEQSLRAAGLRVTTPRTTVLDVVREHPHADSGSIVDDARALVPTVSRQAVFDCLNTFVDVGLVRRIQPGSSPARYELRVGDNHHHAVCRECGAITDVDCALGAAPCLDPSDHHGFVINEAEVIYWGTCPDCTPPTTPPQGVLPGKGSS